METEHGVENIIYSTSQTFSLQVQLEQTEIDSILESYQSDKLFKKVAEQLLQELSEQIPREKSHFPQFQRDIDGLIYFQDWNDNLHLCIGEV